MGLMGVLSSVVYIGGMLFVNQITLDSSNKEAIKKNDKTGVLIFVVIVALFGLVYWVFDILLNVQIAGFIIILVVIFFNFICSAISLVLGNKEMLLKGGTSNSRAGPEKPAEA